METTRHLTATVYVVNDGSVALHDHPKLGIRVPPGGHVDRDELPHEAGLREVREETGLDPTLLDSTASLDPPAGETLPRPRELMLYDIDSVDGRVYHQHVDHVYFATVPSREITSRPGEVGADVWAWYSPRDLRDSDIDPDTVALSLQAIETAGSD